MYTARVLKKVAFVRRLYAHDPHILKIYRSVNRLNSLMEAIRDYLRHKVNRYIKTDRSVEWRGLKCCGC